MKTVDNLLNQTTMYRLVLYCLSFFLAAAFALSFVGGILPFAPMALFLSTVFILVVCYITNEIFAYAFSAPVNVESVYITALILACIVTPPETSQYYTELPALFWVSVIAIASKFIFARGKRHIFNPAAFGVAVASFALGFSASWWIATKYMFPVVLVGGLLIGKKIRRFDLIGSFLLVSVLLIVGTRVVNGGDFLASFLSTVFNVPLVFFAFVMLTEPIATPSISSFRMAYGAFIGLLFAPWVHLGALYFTPELALLSGNLLSYFANPKRKLILKLAEKTAIGPGIYDFAFENKSAKFNYTAGQYMEWMLPHANPDNRGNRRYFTIASSPTEDKIHLGVKFYDNGSSFKKALNVLPVGGEMFASEIAGDFVLPKDINRKLVFIGGGIGVTPFRSMVKYLLDKKEKRDVTFIYSCKTESEIAYREIFDQAGKELGLKIVYVLSDLNSVPAGWPGERGMITAEMIKKQVPDWNARTFYISGPPAMVGAYSTMLKELGVKNQNITTDLFPGFA